MLGAFLLTLLPTLLFYILLPKFGFRIKSNYLRIAFSWFAGMFITTSVTFWLAVVLSQFTSQVLLKATIISLLGISTLLFLLKRDLMHLKKAIPDFDLFRPSDVALISFCLLFPILFFVPQLAYQNSTIYTSPVYWDFHWHAALIQNFAYGDNFPPENEAFSGLTHTYHYFWGIITAMYEVFLSNLVLSINYISALTFFFFLLTLIGLSQELFKSKLTGVLAVLLTTTSSSFHFVHYVSLFDTSNVIDWLKQMFTNDALPFHFAILEKKDFIYNGTFFNLFYFLEERQMIFGAIYLLLSTLIIYKRKEISDSVLIILGAIMGSYFMWHLYIAIMVLCALLFVLILDKKKKKTFYLLLGFGMVFGLHYLYFKQVTQSSWFLPNIEDYPKFNPGFSDQRDEPFSFSHAFIWYLYSYGLKFFLLPLSLIYLWFKNRHWAILLTGIILPTFILLNTTQLSPHDIYENHKWLRPMNIIVDIVIALFLTSLFFERSRVPDGTRRSANGVEKRKWFSTFPPAGGFARTIIGIILLFFLTLSGIIELMPFLNSRPTTFYAHYPSDLISQIRNNTPPKASFIGVDKAEIQLAGRKLFLGDTLGSDLQLDTEKRHKIIEVIYKANDKATFCNLARNYAIDYVEFIQGIHVPPESFNPKGFSTINDQGKKVFFVDIKKTCE